MHSPAAERNKKPILDVLGRVLPETGTVVEVASGTGQHAVYFARSLPELRWQPSEIDAALLESIRARIDAEASDNVEPPVVLDVCEQPWPVASASAVLCINMIHIAPWAATRCLFSGARAILAAGAPLILYGPFRLEGGRTAPRNEAFDRSLRSRDPEWGVREIERVTAVAGEHAFSLEEIVAMPANNHVVVYRRDRD